MVLDKYARLIVEYCVGVEKLTDVVIYGSIEALPLVRELWKEIVNKGAYPIYILTDEVFSEIFYRYAPKELLEYVSPIDRAIAEKARARISILSSTHTKHLINIDPEKIRLRSMALRELREIFMRRDATGDLKWTVAAYPTRAMAQEAGMTPLEFEEFVFRAVKLHTPDPISTWIEQGKRQDRIVQFLNRVDELRFIADDTDIFVKVGGRIWINDDGRNNMPGGEVFTAPHEDSVEGYITFNYPAVYSGYEVEGIRLKFEKGVVVEASAIKGEEFLKKMLQVDEGARRVGELAFGLNYDITRFTKEILFDEKIGGTIHMALGSAYLRTGGVNKSSIHWDMIKDMRKGKVYADKDLVYIDGNFIEDIL